MVAKEINVDHRGRAVIQTFGKHGVLALHGGPPFTLTIGMSLIVNCETQKEIDEA